MPRRAPLETVDTRPSQRQRTTPPEVTIEGVRQILSRLGPDTTVRNQPGSWDVFLGHSRRSSKATTVVATLAALVLLLMPLTAVACVFTDSIGRSGAAAAGCGTDWEGFDSGCETYSDHDANKSQCCWVVVQFDTIKAPVYRKNATLRGEFLALGKDAAMSIVKTYNNGSLLAGTAGISDDPSVTCETSMSLWKSGDEYRKNWFNTLHAPKQVTWWAQNAAPLGVTVTVHSKLVDCAAVMAQMPFLGNQWYEKMLNTTTFNTALDLLRATKNVYTGGGKSGGGCGGGATSSHHLPSGHATMMSG